MSSITESFETGIGSDYAMLSTDNETPQEVEAMADVERVTYEIENPESSKNPATLKEIREKQGKISIRTKLGSVATGESFIFPERGPDGEWVVGTKTLPPKPKEQ